jgi:hypothetical protein
MAGFMTDSWTFSVNEAGYLAAQAPSDPISPPVEAILDWLSSDVGGDARAVDDYRGRWEEASDVAGNGTMQTLNGDEVMFEALYDQWEDFRMPLATFHRILDDYRDFLVRRAAR